MNKKKRSYKKTLLYILMIIVSIITLIVLFSTIYVWFSLGDSFEKLPRLTDNSDDSIVEEQNKDVLKEPINILFLGVDSNKTNTGRSDTIMVVRLNPEEDEVKIVSLPRDTYMEIAGKDYKDKVNHSLVYGVPTTIATVENYFDIKIDYYAMIDFQGFIKAIDALGGIEIDVEKRMKYTDVAGGLYIDLQPGLQTLNGEDALGYARFRHDNMGDIGRIDRQQKVIEAVLEKSTDIRSITKMYSVIDILGEHFKTDIPRTDMVRITTTYIDMSSEDLVTEKVNGESMRLGEQNLWYYVVSEEERQRLQQELKE